MIFEMPAEPFDLFLIVAMGTAIVLTSMVAGYRAAYVFGIDRGIGATLGAVVGVFGMLRWLTSS